MSGRRDGLGFDADGGRVRGLNLRLCASRGITIMDISIYTIPLKGLGSVGYF